MSKTVSKVVVVGGGPAGMMCAVSAADAGHDVVLLEQNEKLGKKLFITGKGRCNITNDSDVDNLLRHTVRNPRFLYSAFYCFDSQRMMDFLEQEGLALKTERGNRVFPVSDHSSDVIKTLEKAMKKRGVSVSLNTRVIEMITDQNVCRGVVYCQSDGERRELAADAVVIATGGLSYPSTGSTGDGYRFARDTGHSLVHSSPSLVPFEIEEDFCKRLQGLSLKNISLRLLQGEKVLYQEQGEMIFTHFGISGPLVLTASCYLKDVKQKHHVCLDFKPALSAKQLDERLLRDFASCKNSHFKNSLSKLLPAKMIPVIVECSGIDPDKQVNEITKEERKHLGELLKGFEMTLAGVRGYGEAIITRGGVSVKEIDPGTMESKKIKGLFFAGEVLDLDAVTGGYNLQIAWSTGYLAGISVS
jgi:hypothetical protein